MEIARLKDLMAEGTLTRRQMLGALGAAGLALGTLPLHPRRARAEGEIMLMTWAGYDVPEAMPGYVAKYGGMPSISIFGEEEEGLQKMRAGFNPDISHPCNYSIGRWRRSGLFKALDVSRLEHEADLWPELRTIPERLDDAGAWFFPWEWGTSSVLFRSDLAPEYAGKANHSWKILFDPKYSDRLGVFDAVDGAVIVAALVAGVPDPFNMTDAELAQVKALMLEQRKVLRTYWTDMASVEQGLASGEIVASYAWPYSVAPLKAQGIQVEYMVPKEGILTWACGLMVLKDHPGPEEAIYDLINAMQSPEAGAWLIANLGLGHANTKSFERVDAGTLEVLKDVGMDDPQALFTKGVLFQPIEDSLREKYGQMLLEVKAGQ
jgi:spermidine/putrescine transport system substrate-binding protein